MAANGNKYDWESITVTLPGGEAVAEQVFQLDGPHRFGNPAA